MDEIINHWQLIQAPVLPPSRKVVGWAESSNPCITMAASQETSSICRQVPKITSLHNKKHLYGSWEMEHSGHKGFRSTVIALGRKTKYVFLIVNHGVTPGHSKHLPPPPLYQAVSVSLGKYTATDWCHFLLLSSNPLSLHFCIYFKCRGERTICLN